jgi:hypothetical protein
MAYGERESIWQVAAEVVEGSDFRAPIGTRFGCARVWIQDGKYWFGLENHDGVRGVEVSAAFYHVFVQEFI